MEAFIKQLKRGDIIFHHAHDTIANIIRSLDHKDYNHCSIYDKDGYIYEMVAEGLVRKKLEDSLEKQKSYAVTNFRVKNLSEDSAKKIIDNIEESYRNRPYAKIQLVLLLILFLKKLLPAIPSKLNFLKIGFIYIINTAIKVVDPKNRYLICSELIYRTYRDVCQIEDDLGTNIIFLGDTSILGNVVEKKELFETVDHKGGQGKDLKSVLDSSDVLISEINQGRSVQDACNNNIVFLDSEMGSLKKLKMSIGNLNVKNPGILSLLDKIDLSNFITPGDIANALNLEKKDTYKVKKHKDCEFCEA